MSWWPWSKKDMDAKTFYNNLKFERVEEYLQNPNKYYPVSATEYAYRNKFHNAFGEGSLKDQRLNTIYLLYHNNLINQDQTINYLNKLYGRSKDNHKNILKAFDNKPNPDMSAVFYHLHSDLDSQKTPVNASHGKYIHFPDISKYAIDNVEKTMDVHNTKDIRLINPDEFYGIVLSSQLNEPTEQTTMGTQMTIVDDSITNSPKTPEQCSVHQYVNNSTNTSPWLKYLLSAGLIGSNLFTGYKLYQSNKAYNELKDQHSNEIQELQQKHNQEIKEIYDYVLKKVAESGPRRQISKIINNNPSHTPLRKVSRGIWS